VAKPHPVESSGACTLLGALAILFWASTIAFARTLSEALGPLRAATYVYLAAGLLSTAWLALRGGLRRALSLPRTYLLGAGIPFVAYGILLYLAVGLAADRQVVYEVLLVNYLWPSLVVGLSVPILGNRARWSLVPGMALALGGIVWAASGAHGLSWGAFAAHARSNALPYALALGAAVTWGLYSNLSRRWARTPAGNAVPLFLLVNGLLLLAAHGALPDRPFRWSAGLWAQLAYMVLFPTILAYTFWDLAMRRGRFVVVAVLSYLTPLLSMALAALWLREAPAAGVWAGGALVVAGAWVCGRSLREKRPERPAQSDS